MISRVLTFCEPKSEAVARGQLAQTSQSALAVYIHIVTLFSIQIYGFHQRDVSEASRLDRLRPRPSCMRD